MKKKLLLILLISSFVFIVIFFIPLKIKIVYRYINDRKYFRVQLIILKILKINILKNKKKSKKSKLETDLKKYINYIHILEKLNIKWDYFHLESDYGLGDPAYTAILYGILWSILGTFINAFNIKEPIIKLNPDCNKKVLTLNIESIFSIYLGNIIHTGFFILKEEIFNGCTKY